jgi:hypothetical protein
VREARRTTGRLSDGQEAVPANAHGDIDHPTHTPTTQHDKGTGAGAYLSHDEISNGTVVAPGANVILIETYNNQRSSELKHPQTRLKELDALRTTILNVFLRN